MKLVVDCLSRSFAAIGVTFCIVFHSLGKAKASLGAVGQLRVKPVRSDRQFVVTRVLIVQQRLLVILVCRRSIGDRRLRARSEFRSVEELQFRRTTEPGKWNAFHGWLIA